MPQMLTNHCSMSFRSRTASLCLLVVLLLHLTAAAAAEDPKAAAKITYRSHYPIDSERPNTCTVEHRSQPLNATYVPGRYIPFIGG